MGSIFFNKYQYWTLITLITRKIKYLNEKYIKYTYYTTRIAAKKETNMKKMGKKNIEMMTVVVLGLWVI